MLRYLVILAASATVISSPAMAQESSGTRVYGGVIAGYDDVELKVPDVGSGSSSDIMYGALIGIETDLGSSFILGFEAEFADSEVGDTERDIDVIGDSARLSIGRDLYVGVRAGYQISSRVNLYGAAGYTNTRVNLRYDDGAGFQIKAHTDRDGVRLGAGLEFDVSKNISLRGEYRHSQYKKFGTGLGFDIKAKRDQLVAAFVVKF